MRSYDTLSRLNEALTQHAETDDDRMYRECWRHSPDIVAGLESDLTAIAGGTPRVAKLGFRIHDPDHRGADTYSAVVRYDPWDVFRVDVIALIDHGIIRVSVGRRPSDARLEPIADILDIGNETHLKDYARRPQVSYNADGIQVLEWFEAIRRKPAMWLGTTQGPRLYWLARELLNVPLNPTRMSLILSGTTLRIASASVPPSVLPRAPGCPPYLVEACTSVHPALDTPATLMGVEILDTRSQPAVFKRVNGTPPCLAIANAFSEAFTFSSFSNGTCWRVSFSRGVMVEPLTSSSSTTEDGLSISFTPDSDIFQDEALNFGQLAHIAHEVASLRRVPIEVRDESSGSIFVAGGGAD